jgi:hypothetical protein
MATWTPPTLDLLFVLEEVVGLERIAALPGLAEATPEVAAAILAEAGRFAADVLAPLNAVGDRSPPVLEPGPALPTPGGALPKAAGTPCPSTRPMAATACRGCWRWRCRSSGRAPTWPSPSARC